MHVRGKSGVEFSPFKTVFQDSGLGGATPRKQGVGKYYIAVCALDPERATLVEHCIETPNPCTYILYGAVCSYMYCIWESVYRYMYMYSSHGVQLAVVE